MSACCGPGCGYCGMCTAAWEAGYEQPDLLTCDRCAGDAFAPVTTPLGVFCSHRCAELDAAEFTERMRRAGHHHTVQPRGLAKASGE